jgi:hypothetical protein
MGRRPTTCPPRPRPRAPPPSPATTRPPSPRYGTRPCFHGTLGSVVVVRGSILPSWNGQSSLLWWCQRNPPVLPLADGSALAPQAPTTAPTALPTTTPSSSPTAVSHCETATVTPRGRVTQPFFMSSGRHGIYCLASSCMCVRVPQPPSQQPTGSPTSFPSEIPTKVGSKKDKAGDKGLQDALQIGTLARPLSPRCRG